jgi:hypothetical protein
MKDTGFKVSERKILMKEVADAAHKGKVLEKERKKEVCVWIFKENQSVQNLIILKLEFIVPVDADICSFIFLFFSLM